jgi:hypothetical protein
MACSGLSPPNVCVSPRGGAPPILSCLMHLSCACLPPFRTWRCARLHLKSGDSHLYTGYSQGGTLCANKCGYFNCCCLHLYSPTTDEPVTECVQDKRFTSVNRPCTDDTRSTHASEARSDSSSARGPWRATDRCESMRRRFAVACREGGRGSRLERRSCFSLRPASLCTRSMT